MIIFSGPTCFNLAIDVKQGMAALISINDLLPNASLYLTSKVPVFGFQVLKNYPSTYFD
jgi:LysM repeat protein